MIWFVSRVGKPLLMFLITFFSVRFITHSAVDGVVVALVPALLGATNVYASFGYSITAAALVLAVVVAIIPQSIKGPVETMVTQSVQDLTHSTQPAAAPTQPGATTTTEKTTATEKKTNTR